MSQEHLKHPRAGPQSPWSVLLRSPVVWRAAVGLVLTLVFSYFVLFGGLSDSGIRVLSVVVLGWTVMELLLYRQAQKRRREN
jgi:hypothetical protein